MMQWLSRRLWPSVLSCKDRLCCHKNACLKKIYPLIRQQWIRKRKKLKEDSIVFVSSAGDCWQVNRRVSTKPGVQQLCLWRLKPSNTTCCVYVLVNYQEIKRTKYFTPCSCLSSGWQYATTSSSNAMVLSLSVSFLFERTHWLLCGCLCYQLLFSVKFQVSLTPVFSISEF